MTQPTVVFLGPDGGAPNEGFSTESLPSDLAVQHIRSRSDRGVDARERAKR